MKTVKSISVVFIRPGNNLYLPNKEEQRPTERGAKHEHSLLNNLGFEEKKQKF